MILSYDIAVDLTPEFNRQLSPKFSVSLGDHGAREYTVKILQGGEPYEIEEGSTVSIVGKKQDGHIFAYACTYADEYVYFAIEEQMTPVSGIVTCELSIIDASDNKVGSANFTYWVEPSPVTDGEASESDLQLFQQILDAADDLDDVREILDRAVPIAEQLGDVEKLLTAFPTEEASGSLLTLTDGADGIPAKKLTLSLSPHQSGSGDPSPNNVRPISGYESVKVTRAGKNICTNIVETHTRAGVTLTRMSDGTLVFNGTATAEAVFYVSAKNGGSGAESLFGITPGEYTISGCPEGGHAQTYYVRLYLFQDTNYLGISYSETGGGRTFTVEAPANRYRVAIRIQSGQVCDNLTFKPQLEVGNTATAYEPYTGEEYDITIPTAAGTVYGGSLEINDDGSGTLTVDRAMITSYAGESLPGVWISDRDVYTPGTMPTNGAQVVYVVATPTTYTITADQVTTLLGDNTVWMDADGSIDLTYRADTQKYIDSRIALLNSNLAFIEDGMTASRAYTVGQYVLISGKLYKVTASIASGATFTIGTNVVATTVGTELTALNN